MWRVFSKKTNPPLTRLWRDRPKILLHVSTVPLSTYIVLASESLSYLCQVLCGKLTVFLYFKDYYTGYMFRYGDTHKKAGHRSRYAAVKPDQAGTLQPLTPAHSKPDVLALQTTNAADKHGKLSQSPSRSPPGRLCARPSPPTAGGGAGLRGQGLLWPSPARAPSHPGRAVPTLPGRGRAEDTAAAPVLPAAPAPRGAAAPSPARPCGQAQPGRASLTPGLGESSTSSAPRLRRRRRSGSMAATRGARPAPRPGAGCPAQRVRRSPRGGAGRGRPARASNVSRGRPQPRTGTARAAAAAGGQCCQRGIHRLQRPGRRGTPGPPPPDGAFGLPRGRRLRTATAHGFVLLLEPPRLGWAPTEEQPGRGGSGCSDS